VAVCQFAGLVCAHPSEANFPGHGFGRDGAVAGHRIRHGAVWRDTLTLRLAGKRKK